MRNYYLAYQGSKIHKLYSILQDMAANEPQKLLYLWSRILDTGMLVCPKDIDTELYTLFDVGSRFLIYDDHYEVSCIKDYGKVIFKKVLWEE